MKRYIPQRGDILWTDFDPAAGREQKNKHPALVLSPETFNKKILLALVAPITSRVRGHAFEVPLSGKKISGVVLCQQVKTIDFVAHGVLFAEKADRAVLDEVLARVRAIIV